MHVELSINKNSSHFYYLNSGWDYVLPFEEEDWSMCIYIPNYADLQTLLHHLYSYNVEHSL